MNGHSYEKILSDRSTIALTKKTITLDPKRTVAGLGEAHWIAPRRIPGPPAKNPKSVVIYSPGPPVTLSMAPRRIPGTPVQNPKSVVIYSPGPPSNPKYGASSPPWPLS